MSVAAKSVFRSRKAASWGWFSIWAIVGAAYAFGLIEGLLGLPFLVVAIIVTVVLARRPASMRGVAGVSSGLGLIPCYMAFINRNGPGDICSRTQSGTSCVSETSPWPWLVAGLLLVVTGLTAFVIHERRLGKLM